MGGFTLKRKFLISLLTVALALSSSLVLGTSYAETNKEKLEKKKEDLEKIRSDKKEKGKELSKTNKERKELEEEIEEIQEELEEYTKKLDKQGQELVKQEKILEEKEEKFKSTIRRLYEQGEFGYMMQILSAESFSEFLRRFESLRIIINQDNNIIKNYRKEVEKTEKQKVDLEKIIKEREPKLKTAEEKMDKLENRLKSLRNDFEELEEKEALTEKEMREIRALLSQGSGSYSGKYHRPTTPGLVYWNYWQWRGSYNHKGVDIPRPIGSPIYAMASGKVVKAGPSSGFGNLIIIDHGNGLSSWYGHMYSSGVLVSTGQYVKGGQRIGSVGNAGQSTGPHLHIEVHKNGSTQNPKNYIGKFY
jgi:murein DD-endopeptidase MepM/ murein hydrolase activator NlpD